MAPQPPIEKIMKAEAQIVELSKRVEFYVTEYTIELLAIKMNRNEFFVPDYQREFTWKHDRQSRFIESILMGLPIPFLFFWESPDTGQLEIVDGSQRLRTIQNFLNDELVLGPLDELDQVEGFRFSNFPDSRQLKIKNRTIRGIILSEHTSEETRFDLFERINTGSKIAEPSELRRGALGGPFLDLVIELSKDEQFRNLAPVPAKKEKEREREELITRFFAYSDGLDGYKDRVSTFLYKYAKKKNEEFAENPSLVEEYRQQFIATMDFISNNFPLGFRKTQTSTTTPRVRFEAIAIGSLLALRERPDLYEKSIMLDWIDSEEFARVTTSDGANVKSKLVERLSFVKDILLGVK